VTAMSRVTYGEGLPYTLQIWSSPRAVCASAGPAGAAEFGWGSNKPDHPAVLALCAVRNSGLNPRPPLAHRPGHLCRERKAYAFRSRARWLPRCVVLGADHPELNRLGYDAVAVDVPATVIVCTRSPTLPTGATLSSRFYNQETSWSDTLAAVLTSRWLPT